MSSSQAERTEATLEKGKTQKLIMEGKKKKNPRVFLQKCLCDG